MKGIMKVIRVDNEVYQALQERAIPLIDNPNTTLRKLLGLPVEYSKNKRMSITGIAIADNLNGMVLGE